METLVELTFPVETATKANHRGGRRDYSYGSRPIGKVDVGDGPCMDGALGTVPPASCLSKVPELLSWAFLSQISYHHLLVQAPQPSTKLD